MRVFKKAKAGGGHRLIFAPSNLEKLNYIITLDKLNAYKVSEYAHGFVRGRNIITNALPHVNKKVTISYDLKDFFDTITPEKLKGKLSGELIEKALFKGVARQGLPTSPAVSNIAFKEIDAKIYEKCNKITQDFAYTRYADDLSISLNTEDIKIINKIKEVLKLIITSSGYKINNKKTKVQFSKRGRREICGVYVDREGVFTNRKFRRKLRAVKHNLEKVIKNIKTPFTVDSLEEMQNSALKKLQEKYEGLRQFSLLKMPSDKKNYKKGQSLEFLQALHIAKTFKLKKIVKVEKVIQHEELCGTNKAFILTDPCYFIGMSSFSTGWTTCMSLEKGQYKQGVSFFLEHPGISIAAILSEKNTSVAGIERPSIKARCLVYILRNGIKCFGTVYGNHPFQQELKDILIKKGYKTCSSTECKDNLVVGNVEYNSDITFPFFDNCVTEYLKSEGEKTKVRIRIK